MKPHGVDFPKDSEGNRSTMGVNKTAFAKAMSAADKEEGQKIADLPDKKWRRAYSKHLVEQVRHSARSEKAALSVAQAGLDYLHDTMVFVRPEGGNEIGLKEAMKTFTDKKFQTYEIQGEGPRVTEFTVQHKPYGTPGPLNELSGDSLHRQIATWVKNGAIEMSCGAAMSKVIDNPEWCDLRDTYFVLFGATSAMGPFFKLMDLGANIIALDLDRQPIWERLIADTRKRSGKLIFPVKSKPAANATDAEIAQVSGCNLLTDTPEIRTWLNDVAPGKKLVCMGLAYLDGAMFMKVSMAMDAIIKSLIETRGADQIMPAYLCTPTDVHLCTADSVNAARSNFNRLSWWVKMVTPILNMAGMPVKKNVEKPIVDADGKPIEGLHLVDCIVPEQGPNYILAKRLQHWRALVSRAAGCTVSSNVAPSTATASVLSNVLFALNFKGYSSPSFKPMEVTYPETSNSVMASLLIRDIRDPTSAANPKTPLRNPLCLFTDNSFHGGCWRTGLKFASTGGPSMLGYAMYAFVINPYLLGYNVYQAFGWANVFLGVVGSNKLGLWNNVGPTVSYFQHLGIMEVLHAAVGMTRSSPAMTFLQIFSRYWVAGFLNCCPDHIKDDAFWIPLLLTCWSIADFTRYIFYCFGLLRDIAGSAKSVAVAMKMVKVPSVVMADEPVFKIPFPLVWLRYSLFIVLYPTGVLSELMCIWMTKDGFLSDAAPAAVNPTSTFTYQTMKYGFGSLGLTSSAHWYFGVVLAIYIVGLPSLFFPLLATRKKQLGGSSKSSSQKQSADKKKQ